MVEVVKIGAPFLGKIVDYLVDPIKRQFTYMCCFNTNITELETQLKELETTRQDVQMWVDENRRKVRVIGRTIEAWLTSANEVTTEVEGIIQDKDKVKEGCLNGWCPNLKLRYLMSRKAVKKTKVVVDLKTDGVQYTQPSYSPPPACLETIMITNRDFMGFESRKLIMEEIIKALKHDEINLIGVCGMGGVGKTTMVNEVAKRAKEDNHFDEVAIAVVSQEPNLTHVQACIADTLGLKNLRDLESPIARADLLRKRLLQDNKKVLVILDDIWVEFDLKAMGIPLEGADKNFKVLYTSRTRDLWHDLRTKKEIPLEMLSKDEAWQLFREKAGDSADALDLHPIAKQIVDECGRLPLALVLIGSALSKKSGRNYIKEIWKGMLDRLTCAGSTPADKDLSSRLALSYEYLEDEQAKRLFLLCCLFSEDEDIRIEDLARYGLGLSLFDRISEMEKVRPQVFLIVDDLKSRYLLLDGKNEEELLLDGKNKEECVKVHDVVRDMGISIASKNKFALVIHGEVSEWPKKDTYQHYTSISLILRKITELPKGLTCPNLEFLLLDCRELKALPCNFFEGMGKLKVLVLKNFKGIMSLPSSLRNLHTLSLSDFNGKLDNVSEFGGLFNLKTLSFRDSRMKELPEAIGELVNLRLLDLTDTALERIPPGVISRLVRLEELYVSRGFKDWEGEGKEGGRNANLREFAFLSNLNTLEIHIRSDVLIPRVPIFSKLKIYKVGISDGIDCDVYISDDISDEELEDDAANLIVKCKRMLWVGSSIPIPSNRGGIDSLLRSSDFLFLEGKGCNDLVQALLLRNGVDGLQQLKFLVIYGCDKPECHANTRNPVHLPIANAPAIFPILKVLLLLGPVNLREICYGPVPAGSFGELTSIRVQNCGRLRNLFQLPIVGCLPQLKSLIISSCGTMEEVFWKDQQEDMHAAANRIEFPKLEVLKLVKLPSLMGFCRGIDQIDFPQLKHLELRGLGQFNHLIHNNCNQCSNSEQNDNVDFLSLFPQKVSLPNLEVLEVVDLQNLERLGLVPLSAGSFSKLEKVSVRECGKLLYVFPSPCVPMLRGLQELTVESCDSLEVVFEVVELQNLGRLGHLPLSMGSFSKLEIISVRDCGKLRCVFPSQIVPKLRELQELTVDSCNSLEVVFEVDELQNLQRLGHVPLSVGSFSKLEKISIRGCSKLLHVVPSQLVPMLRGLQELTVESCDSLEVVFELEGLDSNEPNPDILSRLKFVKLHYLPNLNCISKRDPVVFKYIQTLEIWDCNSLRYLFTPTMTKSIPQLRRLQIWRCEMLSRIVAEDNGLGESFMDEVEFPQLESLELHDLPNLVSFCPNVNTSTLPNPLRPQPLFNEKVAFLGLKYLGLSGLQNVNDLWSSELPTSSFFKLETLNVRGFVNLRSTFHPSLVGGLANLSELVITDCSKMEGVVYWEEEIEDGQGRKVEKTLFPLLRKLQLCSLPKLVSFFPNVNTTTLAKSINHHHNPLQPRPLFNEKVAIPSLEYLELEGLQNVSDLWSSELPTSSFYKLKKLKVRGCTNLKNVFYPSMAGCFSNLQKLVINDCSKMEGVVDWVEERQGTKIDKTLYSPLIKLKLDNLEIYNCKSLRCVFAPTMTKSIPQLRKLQISRCELLSRIVAEDNGLGESSVDEVEFPQLESLELLDLPNLVSFFPNVNVNTNTLEKSTDHYHNPLQPQPLFNEKVAIPSLEYLELEGLQNVSDLWSSGLSTSSFYKLKKLKVRGCANLRNFPFISWIGDLNNTTQGLQEVRQEFIVQAKLMSRKGKEKTTYPIRNENAQVAQLLYTNYGDGVLALGSNGTNMTMWNWPSGKAVMSSRVLPPSGLAMTNDVTGVNLNEAVPCMALSKDNSYIISACGGAISLFSGWTFGAWKWSILPPPASTFLAFYPQDNDIIAIGMEDSRIHIYNHRQSKVKSEMKGHKKRITGLAFSTNLNILVSSATDAQLCIWRIDTWEHLKSVSIQLPAGTACTGDTRVQFHSDQIRLLVSHETQLAIYDASEMDRIRQWVPQDVLPAPISFAVYSCCSKLVYTSFCDGNIGVFDANSLTLTRRIAPSMYLSPAMSSGSQVVYPRVVAANPKMPNQFAIGLTNGDVVLMEPGESEGKWGLSPAVDHNGMLNDRTASSSNTSNHTPHQNRRKEEEEKEDANLDEDEDVDMDENKEDQEEKRKKEKGKAPQSG
ncbi:hypothetical protein RHMOL_Rhmol03G0038700 [Rhododendron molle]|uniref:Uncharacterized protein n=2 Tax=Rhododendron molle TaxID=49168 RepID=A0ACC0PCK7_RHOML|nr:hypothetical protein RHMOL_Rhmol03G0038700 [Rhododendron molle]KAI8562453.1 hypothetical protein RHMOL_Rhmol03G0038700 [Rhododendron molle]